eukprot:6185616-Pleurochrysis_carterae.AAC.1
MRGGEKWHAKRADGAHTCCFESQWEVQKEQRLMTMHRLKERIRNQLVQEAAQLEKIETKRSKLAVAYVHENVYPCACSLTSIRAVARLCARATAVRVDCIMGGTRRKHRVRFARASNACTPSPSLSRACAYFSKLGLLLEHERPQHHRERDQEAAHETKHERRKRRVRMHCTSAELALPHEAVLRTLMGREHSKTRSKQLRTRACKQHGAHSDTVLQMRFTSHLFTADASVFTGKDSVTLQSFDRRIAEGSSSGSTRSELDSFAPHPLPPKLPKGPHSPPT